MSRKSYEFFRCRDNGYPLTIVYLAGKDGQDKALQLEDNGTRHRFTRLRSNSSGQRLQSVQCIRKKYAACCMANT
jgi:hypothetical protein